MKKATVLIPFLILTSFNVSAQKCEKVLFTGKVSDTLRPQSFYNLMVINRRTGQGVFGQPNGTFSVYVSDGDSISLSVKDYPTIDLIVKADSNCQFIRKLIIEGKAKEIKTIEVRPLKSLDEIKEEREALAMRETRMVTGIEVMQSPITALYQAFSKKEQNKRWIAEQTYKDDQRKVVQELIRLYVAYDIINLNEDEFDQFISFLNINETFLKTATEMELITFISDKYDHFKVLNKIHTEENPKWRTLLNTNKDQALVELLNMYVSNKVIDLPSSEYQRFINYMNLDVNFLNQATDLEVLDHVRQKYDAYKAFYKINAQPIMEYIPVSEEDNQHWKWELNHNKDLKAATNELLDLYNEHKVIRLDKDEYDKFSVFMNLKKSFMETATNEQLIQFVRDKYQRYRDFYKD